jgi:hypothetical protein
MQNVIWLEKNVTLLRVDPYQNTYLKVGNMCKHKKSKYLSNPGQPTCTRLSKSDFESVVRPSKRRGVSLYIVEDSQGCQSDIRLLQPKKTETCLKQSSPILEFDEYKMLHCGKLLALNRKSNL